MYAGSLAVRAISGLCALSLALLLASCGGGGGSSEPPPPPSYSVGGTVSGHNGTGLTLRLNVNATLYDSPVAGNGAFAFGTSFPNGTPYTVTVLSQPVQQVCTVANGSGTITASNVSNIAVTCVTNTYSIGGTIAGLLGVTGLVVQNNGGDALTILPGASGFAFTTPIAYGSTYSVTILTQPTLPNQTCAVTNGSGTVAGNVANVAITCVTNASTIGGTVFGLSGTGLILQDNGGDNKTISANGSFTFSTPVTIGLTYNVTVLAQPSNPSQTCVVTNGSGTVPAVAVTNVTVTCTTNNYTIGGAVTGLSGTGLVLRNNGGDNLVISGNVPFTFSQPIASGASYDVTVLTQPSSPTQTCSVVGGTGTVGGGNITNVTISCTTNTYTIGGTISGLTGTGLVLRNNGGNNLTVAANATSFAFSTPIASGATYAVTVFTQPNTPTQTCTVTGGGSGTVVSANITNVAITCTTNSYTIGGSITGLSGTGLVLHNGAENLPVAANATGFTFATPVLSGATYTVTVGTQPSGPTQNCVVASGTGTVGGANVTTVAITCTTNSYTIGGSITGLSGTGLVLHNGAENLPVAANATGFTFATPVLSGATYAVTVGTQPSGPTQNCVVSSGAGTVGGANVTSVSITCTTNTYTIGGSVSGLAGTGLKLRNNNNPADEITIPKTGPFSFTFATPIASGATYAVTVSGQPTALSQICTVTANGTGTVGGAPVTNVAISCATNSFTVGGAVSGIISGRGGVILQLNGANDLLVPANGSFTFTGAPLLDGSNYSVTVLTPPSQQNCAVAPNNGNGTLASVNVTNLAVTCQNNTYTVGGTITGLSGGGLVLRDTIDLGTSTNDLTVPANATSFTFGTQVGFGSTYSVTVLTPPSGPTQTCAVANGSGTVAGAVINVAITCTTNTYTIGGTVSGLAGAGLVLQDNGGDNKTISANGSFTFTTPVASGANYAVTVLTQPSSPTQTCAVTGGTGTVGGANVTTVSIACGTNTYTVGGTITGLSGSGLVLRNTYNLGTSTSDLTVLANATSFTFAAPVSSGDTYAVTVLTQPSGPTQTCAVSNGTGTVGGANVISVSIACTTNTYTIGGSISGLSGTGLVLRNNGGNDLTVAANATSFTFSTPISSGATYAVTVFTQPSGPTQTCAVTNGTGTVGGANVTNVSISCTTNNYTIGGTISGLSGTGLVLRNNGGNNLSITANGAFVFSTAIASGSTYNVTVFTQPGSPTQTCAVTSGTGTVGGANVTNVSVTCTTNTYTIGGSITGLSGTGLVLRNNGGDNLTVLANATSFTFATPIASGATYAVTVFTPPSSPTQTCAVTSGTGTVGSANVTSVTIACTTNSYTIGGTVTGLAGTGLKLKNNGGDELTIAKTGPFTFTFATPVLSGATYAVTVSAQPTVFSQTCTVTGGSGTVGGANVTNATVTCVTPSPRFAYVANFGDASVSVYAVDATTGQLRFRGLVPAGTRPLMVALDPAGKFAYVANRDSNDISAYTINAGNGALTQINCGGGAGCNGANFASGFNPNSVAVDPTGKFAYTANDGSNSVSAFTINAVTGALTLVNCGGGAGCVGSGFAAGQNPRSVTIDPLGKFAYVANKTTSDVSVYSINSVTGALAQIANSPFATGGTGARSVVIDPSGSFAYVANDSSGNVSAFTITQGTGALVAVANSPFASGSATSQPLSVTVDPSGRFAYVVHNADESIGAFSINTTTGALTSIGTLSTGSGSSPVSVTIDPAGKFAYVSNANFNNVSAYSIDGTTGALTALSTFIGRVTNEGMAMTKGAPLVYTPKFAYVANNGSNDVSAYTINSGSGVLNQINCGGGAGCNGANFLAGTNPTSVSVDPSGQFAYVANGGGNVSAYTIDSTGKLTSVGTVTAGTNPQSVAVDGTGRFAYVANGGGTVSAYTINAGTGALTQINCGGGAGCSGADFLAGTTPKSVSVDPSGRIVYVANAGSNNVSAYTINASTGALVAVSLSPFTAGTGPQSVVVDPSGRFAYVANAGGNVWAYRIDSRVDPPSAGAITGSLTPLSGSPVGAGNSPAAVTVDASGRFVYVANSGSGNAISKYDLDSTGNLTAGTGATAGSAPGSVTVDASGKFAYVANSGAASVSGFSINATNGNLTSIGTAAGAGTTPSSVTTTGTVQ